MVRLGLMACCLFCFSAAALAAVPSQQRQGELLHLLKQDCGSCHGMTLKGGLGPALTADVMANKSRELILHTILEGRAGTPMPPWSSILKFEEAEWLVDVLYEGRAHD